MDIKKCFKSINKPNGPKTEREFREIFSLYESQCSASNQPLSQDYQQYFDFYHKITSLYLIKKDHNDNWRTKLIIYDTENERKEEKFLDKKHPLNTLDDSTCITQLPNGELFCYGNNLSSGITLIITQNYEYRILPYGMPCIWSSSIYFNNSVYCFGGFADKYITLACKFDLIRNQWISLSPMPIEDCFIHSVIFNGNILISGYINKNLLLYSVDINSWSIIPGEFVAFKRKILINIERLYLIERDGFIYESEDEYNWQKISNSILHYNSEQIYCSYNKGRIYIAALDHGFYKFDLNQKIMTRIPD